MSKNFFKFSSILLLLGIFFILSCNNSGNTENTAPTDNAPDESKALFSTQKTHENDAYIRLDVPIESNYNIVFLPPEKLNLLRSEYYARAGYIFADTALSQYFYAFDWYRPSIGDIDSINNLLKPLSKENIGYISKIEAQLYELEKRQKNQPSNFTYRDTVYFTHVIEDTAIDIKMAKQVEVTSYKMFNFTDVKYCVKLFDKSLDEVKPLKLIQGIDVDFDDIELTYGNKLFYKTLNTLCCGGPQISRFYNLNTGNLFLVSNNDFIILIEKPGHPTLWAGLYYYLDEESTLKKSLKLNGYDTIAVPFYKNKKHLASFMLSDEERINQVIDIYISEDLFKKESTKYCLLSPENARFELKNITLNDDKKGYNFTITYEICKLSKDFVFVNNMLSDDKSQSNDIVYVLRKKIK